MLETLKLSKTLKPSSRLLFNFIKNGHSLFVQAHERPKMQNNFFVYFFEQFFLNYFLKFVVFNVKS